MTFKSIENYGVIGNQCTAALVALNGSIDFFCFPEFDSPSVFAALLDNDKGGSFSIRPSHDNVEFRQSYVAETNILTTRFLSDTAVAELTDFMPITTSSQKNQITRIVNMIRGSMTFDLLCHPAFDYARSGHTIHINANLAGFTPENDRCSPLTLRASIPLDACGQAAHAEFELHQGESAAFILCSSEDPANSEFQLRKRITKLLGHCGLLASMGSKIHLRWPLS